jgi:hypothetical protein
LQIQLDHHIFVNGEHVAVTMEHVELAKEHFKSNSNTTFTQIWKYLVGEAVKFEPISSEGESGSEESDQSSEDDGDSDDEERGHGSGKRKPPRSMSRKERRKSKSKKPKTGPKTSLYDLPQRNGFRFTDNRNVEAYPGHFSKSAPDLLKLSADSMGNLGRKATAAEILEAPSLAEAWVGSPLLLLKDDKMERASVSGFKYKHGAVFFTVEKEDGHQAREKLSLQCTAECMAAALTHGSFMKNKEVEDMRRQVEASSALSPEAMQSRVDGPTTEDVEALTQLDNLSPQISSCFEYQTGMMAASFVLAIERVARSAGSLERANSNYSEKCLMIAQEAQYHLSGHNPNHYILMNAIVFNFNGFKLADFSGPKRQSTESMKPSSRSITLKFQQDGRLTQETGKDGTHRPQSLATYGAVVQALKNLQSHLVLYHDRTWITMMFAQLYEDLENLMDEVGEQDTPTLVFWVERLFALTRRQFVTHLRSGKPFYEFQFFGGAAGFMLVHAEALQRFRRKAQDDLRNSQSYSSARSGGTASRTPTKKKSGGGSASSSSSRTPSTPHNSRKRKMPAQQGTAGQRPQQPVRAREIGPTGKGMQQKLDAVKKLEFSNIGAYCKDHNDKCRANGNKMTCPWKNFPARGGGPMPCNDVRCRVCNGGAARM